MPGLTYPDCIFSINGSGNQPLGDIVLQAPLGGNPLAQIERVSGFNGPSATGIFKRYTDKFDDYRYYTT